jgi:hypothetical protein
MVEVVEVVLWVLLLLMYSGDFMNACSLADERISGLNLRFSFTHSVGLYC